MKENKNMKKQNTIVITMAFALAFALTPVTKAAPNPGGIASYDTATGSIPPAATANAPAATAPSTSPEGENRPIITIHSTGNILRGKTGSFVLDMKPALMLGGMYVNFKVSGTAVPGVDYAPLLSPARIGKSGYAVLSLKTLADPRGSSNNKAYSVVVTLEPGPGYFVGQPSSAKILISNSCALEACW